MEKKTGKENGKRKRCRPAFSNLRPGQDKWAERRSIIGTPEQCVEKIKAMRAQGIEYFGCNFAFGGMPRDKVAAAMKLFADEVMPHFAE